MRFDISHQWIDGFQPNLKQRWPMPSSSFHIWTRFVQLLREARGELWRVYIVNLRLYKGARTASLPQSAASHSTGNISVGVKKVGHSNTSGIVSSLFLSRLNTAAQ